MQNSSSDLIYVTNEVGISGRFMALARNGQLGAVSEAIHDRASITEELAEVEGRLRSCNDPGRLAEFAIWCSTRKADFNSKLQKLVADLEARKCRLLAKLHQVDQQLDQEGLGMEWEVDPAPMTSLVRRLRRKRDPSVAERNEVIDNNLGLPTQEICKLLDRHFARDGEVSDSFPATWARRYEVHTFTDAYRHPECRNKVHKLISLRRRTRSYPKA
jgi:hypothetical protein